MGKNQICLDLTESQMLLLSRILSESISDTYHVDYHDLIEVKEQYQSQIKLLLNNDQKEEKELSSFEKGQKKKRQEILDVMPRRRDV